MTPTSRALWVQDEMNLQSICGAQEGVLVKASLGSVHAGPSSRSLVWLLHLPGAANGYSYGYFQETSFLMLPLPR